MSALALDDSRLFDTWDRAASLARPWRELALLESASGIPVDELAHLTIGERDRLLLALRIGTFGNRLECETRCPSCGTRLELEFEASELMMRAQEIHERDLEIMVDDSVVRFRLPDSNDISAAMRGEDLAERLVAIIPSAGPGSHPERSEGSLSLRQFEQPPSRIRQRVAERMAELDPQADVSLDLSCAACGHQWQSPFDPAAFLFREVESYVARLTNEVHLLARAYAWSEESILAMDATRRRRYLNLVMQ